MKFFPSFKFFGITYYTFYWLLTFKEIAQLVLYILSGHDKKIFSSSKMCTVDRESVHIHMKQDNALSDDGLKQ